MFSIISYVFLEHQEWGLVNIVHFEVCAEILPTLSESMSKPLAVTSKICAVMCTLLELTV